MLFVEFIASAKSSNQAFKCLCALYYLKHNLKIEVATIPQIRNLLERARVFSKKKTINYSRAIESLEERVDTPASGFWQITPSGEKEIRKGLNLSEANIETENDTALLEKLLVDKINDSSIKDYFNEGIECLGIGRLRACVVFLWSGSIFLIRQKLIKRNQKKLNAAIQKFDPKAREVKKIEDFEYIKDSILLLTMNELGLCDKSQKDILGQCLDLRNKCGHPGIYSPGPKRVAAFIEDLVNILFC